MKKKKKRECGWKKRRESVWLEKKGRECGLKKKEESVV